MGLRRCHPHAGWPHHVEGAGDVGQVTQDGEPLLLTAFLFEQALQVYDARSGNHLRTITQLGESPTIIQAN